MFKKDEVFNQSMMREVVLLFVAVAFIGLSSGFSENIWNNFYNAIHMTDYQRMNVLEPFRETPGLMMMLIIAGLSFLTIGRMGTLAMIVRAAGLLLVGSLVSSFSPAVVCFMVVTSLGDHIFMPLRNSIGITVANRGYEGRVIGFMDAVTTALYIAASIPILFMLNGANSAKAEDYRLYFVLGAIAAFCAAAAMFFMRTRKAHDSLSRPRIVFKKKYTLYYLISFISGFRKQIYLVFAPWLLVKTFMQPASAMTLLYIVGAAATFFFNPFMGHLIDRYGERKLLVGGGIICTAIYVSYVFLCNQPVADVTIVFVLFALSFVDRMTQSTLMGRDIFVKHTAANPDEIMPTLSVGVSMDHVASVIGPFLGGIIWTTVGHQWVFAAGAVIGLIYTSLCFLVPNKNKAAAPDGPALPPEDNTTSIIAD
jgi:MFS family permease